MAAALRTYRGTGNAVDEKSPAEAGLSFEARGID